MKTTSTLLTLVLALAGATACSKNTRTAEANPPMPTSKETAKAIDKAEDDFRTATNKAEKAIEEAGDKARDAVADANAAIIARQKEWNLAPDDIKRDYDSSGRVVREKLSQTNNVVAKALEDPIVVASINAKYLKDPDLSSRKIDVDAEKGLVVLKGTVSSQAQIARAMVLALDTDGVTRVTSELKVSP